MLLAATSADLGVLFVFLAIVAFGAAVYLAFTNQIPAAVVAAFVGVVILVVA